MIEFQAKDGGRYTYSDDINNLQNLALGFSQIFDGCDNFIISGCNVTSNGTQITSGYVYINGKIRKFEGASGITGWTSSVTRYLVETETQVTLPYKEGGTKLGRINYGVTLLGEGDSVGSKSYIALTLSGGKTMKDAFMGKYALLLNPTDTLQTVKNNVQMNNNLTVNGTLKGTSQLVVGADNLVMTAKYNNGNYTISAANASTSKFLELVYQQNSASGESGFVFKVNSATLATIGQNTIVFSKPVSLSECGFNGITIKGDQIYESITASDDCAIWVNQVGAAGGTSYYRNFAVGDGKGSTILAVYGNQRTAQIKGTFSILSQATGDTEESLSLVSASSDAPRNRIRFLDADWNLVAMTGYWSGSSLFGMRNWKGNIQIQGKEQVNIAPKILENGTPLETKYVLKSDYDTAMATLALSNDVYTKTDAYNLFAVRNGGLTQFAIGNYSDTSVLCAQINAVHTSVLADYPLKTKLLSDMITTDADKKSVRELIGVKLGTECQDALKEVGPVTITTPIGAQTLYARQYGKIVNVSGKIVVPWGSSHNGNIAFEIPNSIDPPSTPTGWNLSIGKEGSLMLGMDKDSRSVQILDATGAAKNTAYFSLTYII